MSGDLIELRTAGDGQLFENACGVFLDGVFGDKQFLGNVPAFTVGQDEPQYLPLPLGEGGDHGPCGKNGVEVKSERCGGRELQKYQKRGTKIVKSAQIDNF